jgi:FixJ family two-component response regulator
MRASRGTDLTLSPTNGAPMGSTGLPRAPSYSPGHMARPGARTMYVAIVDDDEGVCRSLARLLRASGIHAVAYSSAEAFLEDTKKPQFDCVVLDVQLPGISGLELQRQLAVPGKAPPVIFITAHDDPRARDEALAAGCVAFFRKTDSGSDVLAAIRRAVP